MWNLLLPTLLTLGGTYLSTQANQHAVDTAANAQLQAAQIQANELNQIRQQAAPAAGYLRNVMATADDLTPAQKQQLEQNRLAITNMIHSSPFAGSGRTAAALFKQQDSDFINTALDQNRQRAIGAANEMYGAGNQATTNIANAEGKGVSQAGTIQANAGTANANLWGQSLGSVGNLINEQQRQSRYNDLLDSYTKMNRLAMTKLGSV